MSERSRERILWVMSPNKWLNKLEINDLVTEARVKESDWGPLSYIISFFSEEAAGEHLRNFGLGRVITDVLKLRDEGALESRIRNKNTGEIIPMMTEEILDSGEKFVYEYRITASGIHRRVKTPMKLPGFAPEHSF